MRTVIIPRRDCKSIYDLESQHYDRVLKFRKGVKYMIVLPSYYGNCEYGAKSMERAIQVYKREVNSGFQGVRVITAYGEVLDVHNDDFVHTDHPGYSD